ncbi:DNA-binding PadR family transcriptional regulator [Clostridium beijerinckii]|uniref:PadR family transcriptional regulator n=1 Tax=Clostridium beijerinckii TaxID=1520 RepID=UPI0018508546|nr:PadR family transcriptional regulator [Clostridium beijerinckii]NRT03908.1 DNA-binding PadR family transcriptional regulator [Clostridium beijerinckii]NRT42080.1 DNA-binding PadR family transcriptional regulator [Clostridium beijerinckii]NRU75598.1 DNA-binding PadR family transcriptional regulator [Clostridium beijerinckii]NRU81057.1 DNA-binding PadR family transcriptional regulator [Clostridium beijerinckii]NRV64682.1 DNA-binding PadR family transcriptional regulator [Clostridium beijerinc
MDKEVRNIIKVLILYYLSIKSTHGYEIQKFIQTNHMDKWTKIQSGSIYYALNKLEKDGLIVLKEEIGSGSKARKIYKITDKGRDELKELVKNEITNELYPSGSDKFIIYPLLNTLDKQSMISLIHSHINGLRDKITYLKKWQKIKVNKQSLEVEKISFEIMISNLEYQIKWHEALIDEIDECIATSNEISSLISNFDFSNAEEMEASTNDSIESLKQEILKNPENASEKLEELIKKLSK